MKMVLDNKALGKYWEDGGRKASRWCSYVLEQDENGEFNLVQKANKKAWMLWLLTLPIQMILLVLALLCASMVKFMEMWVEKGWSEFDVNPITCVNSTIYNKGVIRKDMVEVTPDGVGELIVCLPIDGSVKWGDDVTIKGEVNEK